MLLEDLGDEVTGSVRDDGPGIPDGRLEESAPRDARGPESIGGRVQELGGTAT